MPVLALVPREMRAAFERQLAAVNIDVTFIDRAAELSAVTHTGKLFSVAILPATLPDADLWVMWGELRLLNPRPEILIYARSVNFQIWSGVLEAGGHDVLSEPFSAGELCKAVLDAKRTFEERLERGVLGETS
jgi:DNA-binding response OmpR family regulator